jgi:hypothetical protein
MATILDLDRITITVAEMKHHLRLDSSFTEDDKLIEDFIEVAKEQADRYMQNSFKKETDTGELVDEPIPFSVLKAVKGLVTHLYYNREDFKRNEQDIETPMNFYQVLWPYRKEPWL